MALPRVSLACSSGNKRGIVPLEKEYDPYARLREKAKATEDACEFVDPRSGLRIDAKTGESL